MRLFLAILAFVLVAGAHSQDVYIHTLPFLPSADSVQQGFVRVINDSGRGGTVRIYATDDTGERFGPVDLDIGVDEARHFISGELENGNSLRLAEGVGDGDGHWWLELHSNIEIRVLAYLRAHDGFLTSIHDVVPNRRAEFPFDETTQIHEVAFFNPASNTSKKSILRLVNPTEDVATVTITGKDDGGTIQAEYFLFVPPGARMLDAQALEAQLGDGAGKWRFTIESVFADIWVMSLLQNPTGHLTNVSTVGAEPRIAGPPSGTPPKPPHFRLVNNFLGNDIRLAWWPYPSGYSDHALTHIYRGESVDFTASQRIATTTKDGWGEPYPPGPYPKTYWYWIRWESRAGVLGPESHAESALLWP
ncbi:MAG: hypothetical protein OXC08_20655 [Thiotrichales bacterium]|nr:hypothetical protein [Thiotrichales bacterium]